jgi:hypothetical protein
MFNIIFILIALVWSDMILWPLWGRKYKNKLFNPYRVFQWILQLGISLYLCFYVDIKNALIFNTLIWYGWADILYYIWSDIFGLFILTKPVRTINWIRANETSWMNFTIVGLYNTLILKKNYSKNVIPGWQLLIQAMIGIIISIVIWKWF